MKVSTFRSVILFLPITIILLVIKNKGMDALEVRKRVLCDFIITYEKPDVQGLLCFLQTGYSLDPKYLEMVSNHLNFLFFR